MKFIQLLTLSLLLSLPLTAQPPQAFNYQGVARDASGNPMINANISLRITIQQETLPGIDVYKENHVVQTNRLGVFAIEVGHGSSQLGQFQDIQWGIADHYIKVELDPAGGSDFIEMGTAQLLSVPYALFAGNSVGSLELWSENGKGIHYDSGNVGIGTNNPGYKLTLEGTDSQGDARNYLSLHNKSTSNRSSVGMTFRAGSGSTHTALGHHSPTYDFGNNQFADFGALQSEGAGLIFGAYGDNGMFKFMTGRDNTGLPTERVRITYEGNIGIGTKSPASKLQVADGDVYIEDINSGVIMKSPDGNCWRLNVQDDGSIKTTSIACPD